MSGKYPGKNVIGFGYYSAFLTGLCTVLFGLFLVFGLSPMFSYFACILLSIFYVMVANVLLCTSAGDKKMYGVLAVSFAIIYAVFICLVYFTQLTAVRLGGLSQDVLSVVAYSPGTLFFALDMLGYAFLSLSTLFAAMTLPIQGPGSLARKLLMLHGILFTVPSFVFPMLPLFSSTGAPQSGDLGGTIALIGWCVFFAPICFLLARYFKRNTWD